MKHETHSQASKEKSRLCIYLEIVYSYYKFSLGTRNKMLEISKAKKKRCDSVNTMQDIRKEQKVNPLTKKIIINDKRKSGKQR